MSGTWKSKRLIRMERGLLHIHIYLFIFIKIHVYKVGDSIWRRSHIQTDTQTYIQKHKQTHIQTHIQAYIQLSSFSGDTAKKPLGGSLWTGGGV